MFKRILALTLCLVLTLGITACGKTETPAVEGPIAQHSNAYGYNSWSVHFAENDAGEMTYTYLDENGQTVAVAPEDVETMLDREVAFCGDIKLTNRDLNLYFQQTLYDFSNQYASYLSYIMDPNVNLDEQMSMDGDKTWQETLLEAAFMNFFQVAALAQEAEKQGFAMTDESAMFLSQMRTELDNAAVTAGFADADAYLEDTFGPGINYEVYEQFSRINALAMDYSNYLADQLTVTDSDISTYYDENADMFAQMNVKKDDQNVINVRHILLTVEEDAEDSVWQETEQKAQALLQQWKDGDATEESFAALAAEHTQDPGSAETGGLYEDVYPGQMVETFDAWCFDDSRQVGDTGVVQTSYGYHVMYFVGEGDYIYWKQIAESYCRTNAAAEQRTEVTEQYETASEHAGVIVLEFSAPTIPAPETETETEGDVALNPVEE